MAKALGGTLIRGESGEWRWSDGSPAPQVSDMSASWYYNFRVQAGHVEIPLAVAEREADLRCWYDRASEYRSALSGDHTGPKLLIIGEKYESGDTPGISEPITTVTAKATRADGSKRAIPRVILVPVAEWDAWDKANPVGVKWDKSDEAAILDKARSLGWEG